MLIKAETEATYLSIVLLCQTGLNVHSKKGRLYITKTVTRQITE
jgi:hypothetical protein